MLNPETRITELSRLGFSQPILELSSGRKPHSIFDDVCNDPFYIYEGGTTPFEMEVIPIWENGMVLTAAIEKPNGTEIVEYNLEAPEEYEIIAYSEQGLWANLFASFVDGWSREESSLNDIEEASQIVRFLLLKETIEFVRENQNKENYPELLNEFTKSI